LTATRSRLVTDPETIAASGALSPEAVGATYLAHASQHRRRADGRFIDKLPANFLHIGHIARALPAARIVCLRRHPMDTVWSNYKNLFATSHRGLTPSPGTRRNATAIPGANQWRADR